MYVIAVKYRLYPTPAQETALEDTLEVCRGVYNSFLHWRTFAYETEGKSVGRFEQEKVLTIWKQSHPELSTVYAHLLQNVAVRVDLAFSAFFRRVKSGDKPGYPRMKGYGNYDSLTWKQYGCGARLGENSVRISKIGTIRAIVHRPLPGIPKNLTVRRQSGKWFATIVCESEGVGLPQSDEAVGIDVGLEKFAALSNGEFIPNPRFFRNDEKVLAKAQRRLDKVKYQYRSEARRKAKKVVARVHERIRNRRHNFTHQAARQIVNRYGLIAVEKLSITNMQGNHCLAKSIADASWSMFRDVLTQKAESAGRKIMSVNPAYTSQDCSSCGYRAKKPLKERWHHCPMCGLSLDRDTNASWNILKSALGLQGQPDVLARSHPDLSAVE